jgi:hypothetical protein
MEKTNYEVLWRNGIENDIFETDEPVDNETVFKTFAQAKKKLLALLKNEITEVKFRIEEVKKKTKENNF